MAKKMTPKQLREKADKMLEQARVEEEKLYQKVGKIAAKELNKNGAFAADNTDELKTEIDALRQKINQILET